MQKKHPRKRKPRKKQFAKNVGKISVPESPVTPKDAGLILSRLPVGKFALFPTSIPLSNHCPMI
jgi:hypothetical protein